MSIGWIEVGIAASIAAGAFRGLKRGLVREGLAFAGLAAGLLLAAEWHAGVADLMQPIIGGGRLTDVLAYLLVLLFVLGCATLLTEVIHRLRGLFFVGWIDRIGGMVFGAGQGAVVASVLLFLVVKYQFLGLDEAVRGSEAAGALLGILPGAVAWLPRELSSVREFFRMPTSP